MLHMFHIHILSVCSKYFICFRCMLYSNALCFISVFRESWSMARAPGDQARRAGCRWSRCVARLGPTDGVCSSASWLPGLARAEREDWGRWEGAAGTGTGCVCIGGQGRATRASGRPGASHGLCILSATLLYISFANETIIKKLIKIECWWCGSAILSAC
jgi:hypothetical protein